MGRGGEAPPSFKLKTNLAAYVETEAKRAAPPARPAPESRGERWTEMNIKAAAIYLATYLISRATGGAWLGRDACLAGGVVGRLVGPGVAALGVAARR